MAQCEAYTVRSGGRSRCRREAVRDGACEYGEHQEQVLRARAAAGAAPPTEPEAPIVPTWDDDPPEAPAGEVVDEIARAVAGQAHDADAFAQLAAELGALQEDPAEAESDVASDPAVRVADLDAAAQLRRVSPGQSGAQLAQRFTADSCANWIRILVNPRLEKAGKELLTADEIQEGGQLASEWAQWLLGEWAVESRTGRTAVWLGVVFVPRYLDDFLMMAARMARWSRAKVTGSAPAAPAAAPPSPAEQQPAPSVPVDDPWAEYRNPAFQQHAA